MNLTLNYNLDGTVGIESPDGMTLANIMMILELAKLAVLDGHFRAADQVAKDLAEAARLDAEDAKNGITDPLDKSEEV